MNEFGLAQPDGPPRHGAELSADGTASFAVWGPAAQRATLIFQTEGGERGGELRPEPSGWFTGIERNASEGLR